MIIEIRVKPGSRREGIERAPDGSITVHVRAAPEKGRANSAVIELLAEEFNVAKSSIEILTPKGRLKKVRIRED